MLVSSNFRGPISSFFHGGIMHDKSLHSQALEIVGRYKKLEAELLDILQKIDEKKIFYELGYTSLFDYAVKGLGLSESVSYNFISVARKSKAAPALKIAIASGKLTVSKAAKITS